MQDIQCFLAMYGIMTPKMQRRDEKNKSHPKCRGFRQIFYVFKICIRTEERQLSNFDRVEMSGGSNQQELCTLNFKCYFACQNLIKIHEIWHIKTIKPLMNYFAKYKLTKW